ncbi:MAG: hypothetical protein RLZZ283_351 [Candidatus Parcubacteria bacterium]|jgi:hypothetical protein
MRPIDKRIGNARLRRGGIFKPLETTSRGSPAAVPPETVERQGALKDLEDRVEIATLKAKALKDPEKAVTAMLKLRNVSEWMHTARNNVHTGGQGVFDVCIAEASKLLQEAKKFYQS